jgi:hypothetical protein
MELSNFPFPPNAYASTGEIKQLIASSIRDAMLGGFETGLDSVGTLSQLLCLSLDMITDLQARVHYLESLADRED